MKGIHAKIIWGAAVCGLLLAGICAVYAGMRSLEPSCVEAAAEPRAPCPIVDVCPPDLLRVVAHGQPEVFVDVPSTPTFDGRALMRFVARFREEDRQGGVESARALTLARQTLGDGVKTFDDAVPVLCTLLQDNDSAVRADALTALGIFCRMDDEATGGMGGDGAMTIEEESPEDFRTRVTVVMMTAGLADAELNVRDAAYETLVGLPDEERAQLSLQLLGNDDAELKLALLAETVQTDDEQALTLNFHGLDAAEPEVRQLAADIIKEKTEQTFESSEQAFDWYEKQLSEALGSAEETMAGDQETAEDLTDEGNLLLSTETEQEQENDEN